MRVTGLTFLDVAVSAGRGVKRGAAGRKGRCGWAPVHGGRALHCVEAEGGELAPVICLHALSLLVHWAVND